MEGRIKESGARGRGEHSCYNERLTACKSGLTPELAPEFSVNRKKEWGC